MVSSGLIGRLGQTEHAPKVTVTYVSNSSPLLLQEIRDFGLRQGSHSHKEYLNLEGFLEKSLKIKSALKSTLKSLIDKSLEKSMNSTIFCRI